MHKSLVIIYGAAGCVLSLCAIVLTLYAIPVLRNANSALVAAQDSVLSVKASADSLPAVIQKVGTATDNLGQVIAQERDAQKKQLQEAAKLMAATKEVVIRTNCQLNGGPGCRGLLPQATTTLEDSAQQIQLLAKSGQDTLQSASFLLNSANRRINDQRLDSIVDSFQIAALHFGQTSEHVDLATASGVSILAHGDHVAAYWDKKVTTPPRLIKTITLDALHLITIPLR